MQSVILVFAFINRLEKFQQNMKHKKIQIVHRGNRGFLKYVWRGGYLKKVTGSNDYYELVQ